MLGRFFCLRPAEVLQHLAPRTTLLAAIFNWALALVVAAPLPAIAFGPAGHRLVAELAEAQLKPDARAEATRLLALEPGATLMSIASWADETRSLGTAAWHYVNFPRDVREPRQAGDGGCRYDAARLCIEGNCVVGALATQLALLASNAPDAERLVALKYVVHLVADVHQPLHAGYLDDRGGNSVQLQAFDRGTNLHAVWDSGLINAWPGGIDALRQAVQADSTPAPVAQGPGGWAEESCKVVVTSGFYPDSRTLDASYAARWNAVLVQRLKAASTRLAAVLNGSLVAQ